MGYKSNALIVGTVAVFQTVTVPNCPLAVEKNRVSDNVGGAKQLERTTACTQTSASNKTSTRRSAALFAIVIPFPNPVEIS